MYLFTLIAYFFMIHAWHLPKYKNPVNFVGNVKNECKIKFNMNFPLRIFIKYQHGKTNRKLLHYSTDDKYNLVK